MVFVAVRLALVALRAVAEVSFFLEAQRFLLRFIRPTSNQVLNGLENSLLSLPSTPVTRRWVKSGLHTLHVLVAGNESSPALVLLHGHSMSATFYFRNIDDLVGSGYCVYAVDLLGWGRSDRPKFSGSTPDDSLCWYLNSLHECLTGLNINRCTLMGHSLGGYLAAEYARRYSNQVNRLILISPAACAKSLPYKRAIYFSLPPQTIVRRGGLLGFLLFLFKYPSSIMYVTNRLRDYAYQLAAQHPPSGELAVVPMIRIDGLGSATCVRPLMDNISGISMPVQIVCGETDRSMPIKDVHDLFKVMRLKGCNVDLRVVPGADHCPHLEKPKEFYAAIAKFCSLKTHRPKPGPSST